jgi:hypothetical protein
VSNLQAENEFLRRLRDFATAAIDSEDDRACTKHKELAQHVSDCKSRIVNNSRFIRRVKLNSVSVANLIQERSCGSVLGFPEDGSEVADGQLQLRRLLLSVGGFLTTFWKSSSRRSVSTLTALSLSDIHIVFSMVRLGIFAHWKFFSFTLGTIFGFAFRPAVQLHRASVLAEQAVHTWRRVCRRRHSHSRRRCSEGDGVRGRLLQLGVRCFPFCNLVQRFITKQPKALIANSQRIPVCAAS